MSDHTSRDQASGGRPTTVYTRKPSRAEMAGTHIGCVVWWHLELKPLRVAASCWLQRHDCARHIQIRTGRLGLELSWKFCFTNLFGNRCGSASSTQRYGLATPTRRIHSCFDCFRTQRTTSSGTGNTTQSIQWRAEALPAMFDAVCPSLATAPRRSTRCSYTDINRYGVATENDGTCDSTAHCED